MFLKTIVFLKNDRLWNKISLKNLSFKTINFKVVQKDEIMDVVLHVFYRDNPEFILILGFSDKKKARQVSISVRDIH